MLGASEWMNEWMNEVSVDSLSHSPVYIERGSKGARDEEKREEKVNHPRISESMVIESEYLLVKRCCCCWSIREYCLIHQRSSLIFRSVDISSIETKERHTWFSSRRRRKRRINYCSKEKKVSPDMINDRISNLNTFNHHMMYHQDEAERLMKSDHKTCVHACIYFSSSIFFQISLDRTDGFVTSSRDLIDLDKRTNERSIERTKWINDLSINIKFSFI